MTESSPKMVRTVAVVTGSRAEFGLLRPVMRAIGAHPNLRLEVIVAGSHLLPPAITVDEVVAEFRVSASVPMQQPNKTGRAADAVALGRGVSGFAEHFVSGDTMSPDVVLVLGDRIEAFAAAAAASVAGIRVAHMHGGDRAEGIADEALRHAITKLAHIHLPATAHSAERILCMGEPALSVHLVGSPAIDGLDDIPPLPDEQYAKLGSPAILFLLHPTGDDEHLEHDRAKQLLELCVELDRGTVLALHPNFDAGRAGILQAIGDASSGAAMQRAHLPRDQFVGLLRRIKLIVGNSSAGLIEGAALGVPCVNIGSRQAGRQMPENVISIPHWDWQDIRRAIEQASRQGRMRVTHPYGSGRAGEKTAEMLATFKPEHHPLIKRNTY